MTPKFFLYICLAVLCFSGILGIATVWSEELWSSKTVWKLIYTSIVLFFVSLAASVIVARM